MYDMSVNYSFPKELGEYLTTKNWKESPKVPLRLAISAPIPRQEVMELMPATAAGFSLHKPFVWQFLQARG